MSSFPVPRCGAHDPFDLRLRLRSPVAAAVDASRRRHLGDVPLRAILLATLALHVGDGGGQNSLSIAAPLNDATVGTRFILRGRTVPNARVHLVAGATGNVGNVFAFGAGAYTGDAIADGNGNFSHEIQMQTIGGAQIAVTVTSTDPRTGESAQRNLRLNAQ